MHDEEREPSGALRAAATVPSCHQRRRGSRTTTGYLSLPNTPSLLAEGKLRGQKHYTC